MNKRNNHTDKTSEKKATEVVTNKLYNKKSQKFLFLTLQAEVKKFCETLSALDLSKNYELKSDYSVNDIKRIENTLEETLVYLINDEQVKYIESLLQRWERDFYSDSVDSNGKKIRAYRYSLSKLFKLIGTYSTFNPVIDYSISLIYNAVYVSDEDKVKVHMEKRFSVWINGLNKRITYRQKAFMDAIEGLDHSKAYIAKELEHIELSEKEELNRQIKIFEELKKEGFNKYDIKIIGYHDAKPYFQIYTRSADNSINNSIHLYKNRTPNFIYYRNDIEWQRNGKQRDDFMKSAQMIGADIWYKEK